MKLSETIIIHTTLMSMRTFRMPFKTSFKIAKALQITGPLNQFYTEEYQKIIEQFADRKENGEFAVSEDGKSIKIDRDKASECFELIKELENMEVTLDITFTTEELEGAGVGLSVENILALMPLIEE